MNNRSRTRQLPRTWTAAATLLLFTACLLGCATTESLKIRVNPAGDAGVQYAPEELARMMTDLGYRQLRVEDPVTLQSVTVAEHYGEYRMLFQPLEHKDIRVDIHADMTDGRIALYFYDINQAPLDASALRLYDRLVERVRTEYGDSRVSASRP